MAIKPDNRKFVAVAAKAAVITLAVIAFIVFVVWPLIWQLGFGLPGIAEFMLHRSRYEGIVAKVKQQNNSPGTDGGAIIDGLHVGWRRTQSGKYQIEIMTVDWDHAGSWGYVYSEFTPQLITSRDDEYDVPGGLPFINGKIVNHWWRAYTDLN